MVLDQRIRNELMCRAGNDTRAIQMWGAYIAFLECCPALNPATGTAVHHILWQSEYKRFEKSKWNLIRLSLKDHTAASALMLGAEPDNLKLFRGFKSVSGLTDRSWKPGNPAEVIRLYAQSNSPKLSKRYGVSVKTVLRFLRRHGVKIHGGGRGSPTRFDKKDTRRIIALYKRNWSLKKISKAYNLSTGTIRRLLCKNGVKIRTSAEARVMKLNKKETQRIISSYNRGLAPMKICGKYGVSPPTVFDFLRRNGVEIRTRGESQRINRQLQMAA